MPHSTRLHGPQLLTLTRLRTYQCCLGFPGVLGDWSGTIGSRVSAKLPAKSIAVD